MNKFDVVYTNINGTTIIEYFTDRSDASQFFKAQCWSNSAVTMHEGNIEIDFYPSV